MSYGNATLTLCNGYLKTNNQRKVNYICKHIKMPNKNEYVKQAIINSGNKYLYLIPYNPQLNPI